MTTQQILLLAILATTLALLVRGRPRHDGVALGALLASVVAGIVPAREAFAGFAEPAVVTVAAVLALSRALQGSGVIEWLLEPVADRLRGIGSQVLLVGGLTGLLSTVMNNVGAVAVVMPAAIQIARLRRTPVSRLLMPLAAMSLLGGLVTLIGTPPNILISTIRRDLVGAEFGFFDFTPVGLALALLGLGYLSLAWRLLPVREPPREEPFRIEDYIVEVVVEEGSPWNGHNVGELEEAMQGDLRVLALLRRERPRAIASRFRRLLPGDVLQIEVDPSRLEPLLRGSGLRLAGRAAGEANGRRGAEPAVVEAVVTAGSPLAGTTAADFRLRERYAVNLLAVRRGGERPLTRLGRVIIQPGDVLMLEAPPEGLGETLAELGCLALSDRGLRLGTRRLGWDAPVVLGLAVLALTTGLLPAPVAFTAAVLGLLLRRTLAPEEAHRAIEWPVIVLLGALIPVTDAIRTTGLAELLAGLLARATAGASPLLALVLAGTMLVTPLLNNAATVLLVAPIAAAYARQSGLSLDPFLMAVAIGASADFLTPFGHASNTLVLAPGGYRFTDYGRLGLPLSLLVFVATLLLLPRVRPLVPPG